MVSRCPVLSLFPDRIVSLGAMIVGLLLYGYALSVIAATITNLDSFRVRYQERLFAVKQFLIEREVEKYLQVCSKSYSVHALSMT